MSRPARVVVVAIVAGLGYSGLSGSAANEAGL
jgi:uncharacterized membrane protein YtjA (UPF0391 family)